MSQDLLRVLKGEALSPPPLWFMRQAGRFLPEYRAIREKATFEQLLTDPDLAAEVTLQPVRRFPKLDGAIIFCDILVILDALGCGVTFPEGGPRLDPHPGPARPRPAPGRAGLRARRRRPSAR